MGVQVESSDDLYCFSNYFVVLKTALLMLEDKEYVLKQSHLQVETDFKAVPVILEWFKQFDQGLLPTQFATQCKLALIECFTVVVRKAHNNLPSKTPIELELKLFADYLEIRILERGMPFCLLAHLIGHLAQTEGDKSMKYIPLLIDEICSFRLTNKQNCLVMRKRLVKNT